MSTCSCPDAHADLEGEVFGAPIGCVGLEQFDVADVRLRGHVDLLVPRGSARLIQAVVRNSKVPVIETGAGNVHIYVDRSADLTKAIPILLNAKTQRVGVCNAAEKLIVHRDVAEAFLPMAAQALANAHVAMKPNTPPSVKRVEALTMTTAESMSFVKRSTAP